MLEPSLVQEEMVHLQRHFRVRYPSHALAEEVCTARRAVH